MTTATQTKAQILAELTKLTAGEIYVVTLPNKSQFYVGKMFKGNNFYIGSYVNAEMLMFHISKKETMNKSTMIAKATDRIDNYIRR